MVDILAPTLAPGFGLEVEGQILTFNLTQFIESVEYESYDGMADIARIRATNPDFILSESKVFQPGNEMNISMGYGKALEHIGRVVIAKQMPNFPENDMPTIQVVGYTLDSKMMDNEPPASKKIPGRGKGKGKGGRLFENARFSEAVEQRADDYDMELDIDRTPDAPHNFWQRPGISDYEFVRGLANINGFLFWVDGEANGKWTLHFKDPEKFSDQDQLFTFVYNRGNESSLLDFTPELLIQGASTKISVVVKDIKTGRILKADVEEENNESPDLSAVGDLTGQVEGEATTASDIKLFINDFSFNIISNRKFKTEAEITRWAQQWFRRHRENFILSQGRTIGIESLRARQTHKIDGVSTLFNGDYYFTKARHIVAKDSGYTVEFGARKVVPS